MNKYPFIEDTIELTLGLLRYRLWIKRDDLEGLNIFKGKIAQKIEYFYQYNKVDRKGMIEFIHKTVPDITALQIIDAEPWKDALGKPTKENKIFGIMVDF